MSAPTREQVAYWAREAGVDLNFTMYTSGPVGSFRLDEFMRMMSAAYAAGQSAERDRMRETAPASVAGAPVRSWL